MIEFLQQDVTVPAYVWLTASACTIYCALELATYIAKRKWREFKSNNEE